MNKSKNLNIKQQIILKQIGFYSYPVKYKYKNKFENA